MAESLRALVLDIEGTTTPLTFVHRVLFPYAQQRLADVVRARHAEPQIAAILAAVAVETGRTLEVPAAIEVLLDWSRQDRKIKPLKDLQGLIWEQGYRDGSLRSPMYPDVLPALREWRARGLELFIYSSGSVAAQRLLFGNTSDGDFTGYLQGYFDTTVGAKVEAASYRNIQSVLGHPSERIGFLSDHAGEIAAAHAAGWQAVLVAREAAQAGAISSFAELSDRMSLP